MRKLKYKISVILIFHVVMGFIHCSCATDLLDIYLLAQQQDPDFAIARLSYLQKIEELKMTKSLLLPKISATTSSKYCKSYNVATSNVNQSQNLNYSVTNYNLNVNQPLLDLAALSKYKGKKNEILGALKRFESSEQSLILRVTEKYFAILIALDNVAATTANCNFLDKQLAQIKQRFKVGASPITDLYAVQARRDNCLAKKIADHNLLKIAKEQLSGIVGKNLNNFKRLDLEFTPAPPTSSDVASWLEQAKLTNPLIAAARYDLLSAQEKVKAANYTRFPVISLNADLSKNRNPPPFKNYNSYKQIGLNLNLPIFTGGLNLAYHTEAVLGTDIARQHLEAISRELATNITISLNNIFTAIHSMEALNQSIKSNTMSLEADQTAFNAGIKTLLDVLDSEVNLIDSNKKYAASRYDYIINNLKLKLALGTLSLGNLKEINNVLTIVEEN